MPTSTNLGLVTPASTDFVMNGATNMTTLANGVDAFFGAPTVYTPTYTNVTTGAADARYRKIGRLGFVTIDMTGGTATAAGTISISLPAGWTHVAQRLPVTALNVGSGLISCEVAVSGTAFTVYASSAWANWTLGAALSGVSINAVLQLAA